MHAHAFALHLCIAHLCVHLRIAHLCDCYITQTQQALLQNVIKHLQRTQQGQWLSSEGAAQRGLCP